MDYLGIWNEKASDSNFAGGLAFFQDVGGNCTKGAHLIDSLFSFWFVCTIHIERMCYFMHVAKTSSHPSDALAALSTVRCKFSGRP